MEDLDLEHLGDLEEAERKAAQAAERQPEELQDEGDCDGCMI